jgi:hypothetical protein
MEFKVLLGRIRTSKVQWAPPKVLMAIDPGKTTGIAIFKEGILSTQSQVDTSNDEGIQELVRQITYTNPNILVCEDYRVYSWKAKEHSWEALNTPQLIGVIKYLCTKSNTPIYMQMAQMGKGFCTDKKLREWGFYRSGLPHSRDAVRHGCYWLLFHKEDK